jgi:hypothetical protein
MRTLSCWLIATGLLAAACGGDDDDGPRGRGSAACQDFQDAICDFGADRCGASSRAECDASFQGIECKSDSAASGCANALNATACGQRPAGCDLAQVIDPAPAVAKCEALFDAACDHLMACGQVADRATCVATTSAGLSCAQAVSASLDYERCIDEIESASCSVALPQICRAAIRVLPPGVLGVM